MLLISAGAVCALLPVYAPQRIACLPLGICFILIGFAMPFVGKSFDFPVVMLGFAVGSFLSGVVMAMQLRRHALLAR